eukprot:3725542-Rhodomonas_salina.3
MELGDLALRSRRVPALPQQRHRRDGPVLHPRPQLLVCAPSRPADCRPHASSRRGRAALHWHTRTHLQSQLHLAGWSRLLISCSLSESDALAAGASSGSTSGTCSMQRRSRCSLRASACATPAGAPCRPHKKKQAACERAVRESKQAASERARRLCILQAGWQQREPARASG